MTLFTHDTDTDDIQPLVLFRFRRTLFAMGHRLRDLIELREERG